MRTLAALLILTSVSCASVQRGGPEATVAEFLAAFNALELEHVGSLLTDDATAFLPMPEARAKITGRAAILAALTPLFDRQRAVGPLHLAAKGLTLQPLGPDAAVATFDVGTAEVSSRRTLVLVRRGGGWRIAHLHASNLR
ncbi:MAG TPA: nuclear transport factor 2 family protein [Thermoanaerobaculia bacterium]|jgi:ketosteroid isomerase-like protein|nr:nuclear transport factor 2 family protein [Thermoanaerobaculia bacterium]